MSPFNISLVCAALAVVAFVAVQSGGAVALWNRWRKPVAADPGDDPQDWPDTLKPDESIRRFVMKIKDRAGADNDFVVEACLGQWSPGEAMAEQIRRLQGRKSKGQDGGDA